MDYKLVTLLCTVATLILGVVILLKVKKEGYTSKVVLTPEGGYLEDE